MIQIQVPNISPNNENESALALGQTLITNGLGLIQDDFSASIADLRTSISILASVTLSPTSSTRNVIQPTDPAVNPLIIKAAASQTASLTEWQDSSGNALISILAGGQILSAVSGSRSASGIQIAASTPSYGWRATGGAANSKQWDMGISGATTLVSRAISDDDATVAQWLAVTRSGVAITDISFGNATDNPTFNFLGTGSFVVGGNVAIGRAASGASVTVYSQNTSNTANSSAGFVSSVAGSSAGDAFFTATITGGSTATWGLDNSISGDPFVLAFSNALGSSNIFSTNATDFSLLTTLSVAGRMAIGGSLASTVMLEVNGNGITSGVTQYGIACESLPSSAATAGFNAGYFRAGSAAAAYTQGYGTAVAIVDGNKGAGSTISIQYGMKIEDLTVGATNYAIYTGLGTIHFGDVIETVSGNESTGAGSALLGANSPAGTLTAPYKWIKWKTSDGSTVYVPAWK